MTHQDKPNIQIRLEVSFRKKTRPDAPENLDSSKGCTLDGLIFFFFFLMVYSSMRARMEPEGLARVQSRVTGQRPELRGTKPGSEWMVEI